MLPPAYSTLAVRHVSHTRSVWSRDGSQFSLPLLFSLDLLCPQAPKPLLQVATSKTTCGTMLARAATAATRYAALPCSIYIYGREHLS